MGRPCSRSPAASHRHRGNFRSPESRAGRRSVTCSLQQPRDSLSARFRLRQHPQGHASAHDYAPAHVRPTVSATRALAPPPTPQAPATSSAPAAVPQPACYPLTSGGNCYRAGEYCRNADHGMSGIAENGERITCEDNDGWRWEPA